MTSLKPYVFKILLVFVFAVINIIFSAIMTDFVKVAIFVFFGICYLFYLDFSEKKKKVKYRSLVFIWLLFSFLNLSVIFSQSESYLWKQEANGYKMEVSVIIPRFNFPSWKDEKNIIVRPASLSRKYTFQTESGLKDILLKIKLSRSTWEVFNFNEKEFFSFLKGDLEKYLNENPILEKLPNSESVTFEYTGKKLSRMRIGI